MNLYLTFGVSTGIVFWYTLNVISTRISSLSSWAVSYKSLKNNEKVEWNSRVISSIHAVLVVSLSLLSILTDPQWHEDSLFYTKSSNLAYAVATLALSYWIYDLFLICFHWKTLGSLTILAHHVVGVASFFMGFIYREFVFYAPLLTLTEFSTPCVNQRWFFAVSGMKNTLSYSINGFIMWISFLLLRVIFLTFVLCHQYRSFKAYLNTNYLNLILIAVGTLSVFMLSLYWFILITRGLYRTIFSKYHMKSV